MIRIDKVGNNDSMQNLSIEPVSIFTSSVYPPFPYESGDANTLAIDDDYFTPRQNEIENSIRLLFEYLKLDKNGIGQQTWNPLGQFVSSGGTIVIKPNFVRDSNDDVKLDSLITHTSIIKVLLDYSVKALNFRGTIVVGDSPLQSCNFDNLLKKSKILELINIYINKYCDIVFQLEDWRTTTYSYDLWDLSKNNSPQIEKSVSTTEYVNINLEDKSFLSDIDHLSHRYRVSCYNPDSMLLYHSKNRHEYILTKRFLDADLIINVPKLKTHIKTGISASLKNMIGFVSLKECLPHYIKGSAINDGDNYFARSFLKHIFEEYEDFLWRYTHKLSWLLNKIFFQLAKFLWYLCNDLNPDKIYSGSWIGNKTLWRTILDINHILYFFDSKTNGLCDHQKRSILTIVDGIISGEDEGPLNPNSKKTGILMAGFNPALIDYVASLLMGYDPMKIPLVEKSLFDPRSKFKIFDISKLRFLFVNTKDNTVKTFANNEIPNLDFSLPKTWFKARFKNKLPNVNKI